MNYCWAVLHAVSPRVSQGHEIIKKLELFVVYPFDLRGCILCISLACKLDFTMLFSPELGAQVDNLPVYIIVCKNSLEQNKYTQHEINFNIKWNNQVSLLECKWHSYIGLLGNLDYDSLVVVPTTFMSSGYSWVYWTWSVELE